MTECGAIDVTTGRRCTRGKDHPDEHTDEPNGETW